MGKRRQRNKLIDNLSAQTAEETSATENVAESVDNSIDEVLAPNRVTTEVAEKLEQAEDLKTANAQLFQEKSDLTDQLSTYIAQNNILKNEVEQLKIRIKELEDELNSEKSAKTEIQNQADDYLMKISDMSYELAQLKTRTTSMANSTATCEATIVPDPDSNQNTAYMSPKEVVYNKLKRYKRLLPRNGYSSWN